MPSLLFFPTIHPSTSPPQGCCTRLGSATQQQLPEMLLQEQLPSTAEVPLWFREYVDWHRQQLSFLGQENWHEFKFLLHHCQRELGCGGTADRFKTVPYVFKRAAKFRRIIFYAWEKKNTSIGIILGTSGNQLVAARMVTSEFQTVANNE
jgi:hypothetical protein